MQFLVFWFIMFIIISAIKRKKKDPKNGRPQPQRPQQQPPFMNGRVTAAARQNRIPRSNVSPDTAPVSPLQVPVAPLPAATPRLRPKAKPEADEPFETGFTEGIDPCHDELLPHAKAAEAQEIPAEEAAPSPLRDEQASELLRGIVLAEILGKPVSMRGKAHE